MTEESHTFCDLIDTTRDWYMGELLPHRLHEVHINCGAKVKDTSPQHDGKRHTPDTSERRHPPRKLGL